MRKGITKATPIEIKRERGTVNTTRERRKGEPEFRNLSDEEKEEISIPVAPSYLNYTTQEAWGRIARQMMSVNIFFPSCYEYLEAYCRALQMRDELWKELEQGVTDIKGKVKPAFNAYNKAVDQMVVIGAKLGISPCDKSKLSLPAINRIADKNRNKDIGKVGTRIGVNGEYY